PARPNRIDPRLVGLGDLAEMVRRHPIARVAIRVKFPRQTLVRPLDGRGRRAPLQTEDDVEIHHSNRRYCFPSSTSSASMTSPVFVPAPPCCGPPCAAPPAPPAPPAPGPPGAPPGALPAACCRYSASAALCCAAVS